jgi:hypothetical protein
MSAGSATKGGAYSWTQGEAGSLAAESPDGDRALSRYLSPGLERWTWGWATAGSAGAQV